MASTDAVQGAFEALSNALATGDIEGFYGMMHPDAVVIDEDIPFLGRVAEFKAHIDWHISGIWEFFNWVPRYPRFVQHGDSGAVCGYATFRGKPVDAGYRQRHLLFSQGWAKLDEGWRLVNWLQSTFDGHVLGASPG